MIPVLQDIDYNENDGYRIILKDSNEFLCQRLTEYYEENKRDMYNSKNRLKNLRIGLFMLPIMETDYSSLKKNLKKDIKETK